MKRKVNVTYDEINVTEVVSTHIVIHSYLCSHKLSSDSSEMVLGQPKMIRSAYFGRVTPIPFPFHGHLYCCNKELFNMNMSQ